LPTARKHDPGRIAASGDHARKFAAGDDVEAAAQAREQIQDRQAGVGLDCVAHQMRRRGERVGVALPGGFERGTRIHIEWRAVAVGKFGQGHAFDLKLAVDTMKRVHGVLRCGSDWTGVPESGFWPGRYNAPLEPQPASVLAASTQTIRMARNFMRRMVAQR
jgi:hypothetical protein